MKNVYKIAIFQLVTLTMVETHGMGIKASGPQALNVIAKYFLQKWCYFENYVPLYRIMNLYNMISFPIRPKIF